MIFAHASAFSQAEKPLLLLIVGEDDDHVGLVGSGGSGDQYKQ